MNKIYTLVLPLLIALTGNSQTFSDNFDSYNLTETIASQSSWFTWSGNVAGGDDTFFSDTNAFSAPNSLWFDGGTNGGPVDIIKYFENEYVVGNFEMEFQIFVQEGKRGYINLQRDLIAGQAWALNLYFNANNTIQVQNNGIPTFLEIPYNQNTWFNFKIQADLSHNIWEVFIDNTSVGTFENNTNQVASVNFYPTSNSVYGIDNFSYTYTPAPSYDIILSEISVPSNVFENTNFSPSITITNIGNDTVTTIEVESNINGTILTETISNLSIPSAQDSTILLSSIFSAQLNNNAAITVTSVNGNIDNNPVNNSNTFTFSAVPQFDVNLVNIALNNPILINGDNNVKIYIDNLGSETITSLDLELNYNGVITNETLNGLAIPYLSDSIEIELASSFLGLDGENTVSISVTNVNTNNDADNSNNNYTVSSNNTLVEFDVELNEIIISSVLIEGVNYTPIIGFTNLGHATINNIGVTLTHNGSTITENAVVNNIELSEYSTIQLSQSFTALANLNDITVTVESINNNQDNNPSNNTLSVSNSTLTPATNKVVFVENSTGNWCGDCPKTLYITEALKAKYGDLIAPINVHNSSVLTNDEYDISLGSLINGYPNSVINRNSVVNADTLEDVFIHALTEAPKATISNAASFDLVTHELAISATVKALSPFNKNYTVAIVISEDSIKVAGPNYNQANNFSNGNLFTGGYELLSNPVLGSLYYHNDVLRNALPSFNGISVFQENVEVGEENTLYANMLVPANWDVNNLIITSILMDENGKVNNANRSSFAEAALNTVILGSSDLDLDTQLKVYPNPAKETVNISFLGTEINTIEIIDVNGKAIYRQDVSNQSAINNLSVNISHFKPGIYFVKAGAILKKLVID